MNRGGSGHGGDGDRVEENGGSDSGKSGSGLKSTCSRARARERERLLVHRAAAPDEGGSRGGTADVEEPTSSGGYCGP